jgi:hypothetical protein
LKNFDQDCQIEALKHDSITEFEQIVVVPQYTI